MTSWDDLVSVALLGTARRAVPDPAASPLRSLADTAVGHSDPAGKLLDQAALLATYRCAGRSPVTGVSVPDPAPAETRPRVSSAAAHRLAEVLTDRPGLLTEWLTVCAEAGSRVPEELLPELFGRATGSRTLATALAPVVGERGRWLATHNPPWQQVLDRSGPATDTLDPEAWDVGPRVDRVAYLAALRHSDPDAARELLDTTWTSEEPADRAEFLALFGHGLSGSDEPFLEQALDDRRKEVRAVAAELLGRLPGSAYRERMRARLAECVRILPGSLPRRGPRLVVKAPEEADAAMRRDGIPAARQTRSQTSTPGMRLAELVRHAPLSWWTDALGQPPDQVVTARFDDHGDDVRAGWWQAALDQRDAEWAAALLATWQPGDPVKPDAHLALLPAERRSVIAADVVARHRADAAVVGLIAACPGPWNAQLGAVVLDVIRYRRRRDPFPLINLRRALATRLPADLAPDVEALAEERIDAVTDTMTRVADDIRFRHDMTEELR